MAGGDILLVAVAVAAGTVFGLVVGLLLRRVGSARNEAQRGGFATLDSRLQASTEALQRQVAQLETAVDRRLADGHTRMEDRLRDSERAVNSVRESLVRVDAANARLSEVGRDIAGLHDLLRAPKARGGLGELLLEEILSEVLPRRAFTLQHTFRSGRRVDAAITLGDRLIPIDAKFPLESVRRAIESDDEADRSIARAGVARDIRRHVDDIASRYIVPEEGTLDLALMYVPSERVYHEAILDDSAGGPDLYAYCLKRRVVPVSPNTFYAYLSALLVALRGVEMEERARAVGRALGGMREDLRRFEDEFGRLGTHLTNAGGAYQRAERRTDRLAASMDRLESLDPEETSTDDAPPDHGACAPRAGGDGTVPGPERAQK